MFKSPLLQDLSSVAPDLSTGINSTKFFGSDSVLMGVGKNKSNAFSSPTMKAGTPLGNQKLTQGQSQVNNSGNGYKSSTPGSAKVLAQTEWSDIIDDDTPLQYMAAPTRMGLDKKAVNSPFGPRDIPAGTAKVNILKGSGKQNNSGIDLAGKEGEEAFSVLDGVVKEAKTGFNGGYGNYVLVEHEVDGKKYFTRYSHLSGLNAKPGDKLSKGQVVGKIGATGNASGAHLDFELFTKGQNGRTQFLDTNPIFGYGYAFQPDRKVSFAERNGQTNNSQPQAQTGGDAGKIQSIIDKYSGGRSPLSADMLLQSSQRTGVPVDMYLTSGILESSLGTAGRAVPTRNPMNVGNITAGDNKPASYDGLSEFQKDWMSGLDRFGNLIKKEYFNGGNVSADEFVARDFKRKDGARYATDPNYRSKYEAILKSVRGML